MRKESLAFLEALVNTPSPSGYEAAAQELCRAYIAPYADEVYKDVHGNQFAIRNPEGAPRVLLDAHVDEVGFMVNNIDDKGFIGFVPIGGVDPLIPVGQQVLIHAKRGPVPGVVGRTPPHLMDAKERGKPVKMHQLWIDIAAKDGKDAEKAVALGDPITIDTPFRPLRGERVTGRGFDDRVGVFVILEAMRLLARRKVECSIVCLTAVQEEIGMRGATTGAYTADPDLALAVEYGWTTDHPGVDKRRFGNRCLGKGPLISRGPNINPTVEKQLRAAAKRKDIPCQIVAEPKGSPTDANIIQLTRGGIATGLLRVPGRYLHSPVEIVSLRDVDWAIQLIVEWICSLKPGQDYTP